ncbi:MAG: chemotaxis protein CheD, partial [Burkholderiaceae bacterium]|nr:chemotaxis protein CheD [Burkholderiaceae bacterium]
MDKPAHTVDIFLQPGEVYFGGRDTRIRTLLGSCVAITMWHPGMLAGGMCHYMLPGAPTGRRGALDGRYADEAMELMLCEICNAYTSPD